MTEEELLTGPLEPTNESYAIAKIAGIKLCQAYRAQYGCNFISAMPTNLYGPNDNFDLQLQPRAAGADPQVPRRQGRAAAPRSRSGAPARPRREFLHVDDLADACLFLMDNYEGEQHINVGTGVDLSIRELAEMVRDVVYPEGELGLRHRPSPTARRASCSTSSASTHSAGRRRSDCARASNRPTPGSSSTLARQSPRPDGLGVHAHLRRGARAAHIRRARADHA